MEDKLDKKELNFHEALQLSSLLAVLDPDSGAIIRSVQREYSKIFHTPLHIVVTLPIEDVYRAYWEETFSNLDENDRAEVLNTLTQTKEDVEKENKSLEQWEDALSKMVLKDQNKEAQKKKKVLHPMLKEALELAKKEASEKVTAENSLTPFSEVGKTPDPPQRGEEETIVSINFDLDRDPLDR